MSALPKRELNRMLRRQSIIDAAMREFSDKGFSGASMDVIAAAAGLTKPTLYQYFPSKEELFNAMMTEERDEMLDVFLRPAATAGMVGELHAFAWRYADIVMRPDMLSLARLIISEAQRFPDIGRAYQASGPDHVLRGMVDYLTRQRALNRLSFDDAELAAEDLWGLILSAPRNKALHIPDYAPDRSDLERYVRNGLTVFLRAYSLHPDEDVAELATLKAPPFFLTEQP